MRATALACTHLPPHLQCVEATDLQHNIWIVKVGQVVRELLITSKSYLAHFYLENLSPCLVPKQIDNHVGRVRL